MDSRATNGVTLGIAIGAALIGVGFTMKGDVSYVLGTALVVLGLVVFLASAVHAYRLVRQRNRRAVPPPVGTLARAAIERSGTNVYLAVENLSASAKFWATISNELGMGWDWPDGRLYAKWEGEASDAEREIPRRGTERLLLGRLENNSRPAPVGIWYTPYISENGPGEARAEASFLFGRDHRDTIAGSIVEHRVTLFARPDLASGPRSFFVRFIGNEVQLGECDTVG